MTAPFTVTRAAARARLLTAATITEYPGGTPVLSEAVTAALKFRTCRVTDHGDAGLVIQVDPATTALRFVIR